MKVSTIFLLISLFAMMKSSLTGFGTKYCKDYSTIDEDQQAYSRGFCRSLAIDSGYAQCCYLKYKVGDNTYYNCAQLTLSQYYDIDAAKDYIKNQKAQEGLDISIKSLECTSSSYLYGSFLLLLFILF